jgi:hypothetical protein
LKPASDSQARWSNRQRRQHFPARQPTKYLVADPLRWTLQLLERQNPPKRVLRFPYPRDSQASAE